MEPCRSAFLLECQLLPVLHTNSCARYTNAPAPPVPSTELEAQAEQLQGQLAQQGERAEAQAAAIVDLQSSCAALEEAAAARAAEVQSLSLQLEEAQEALATAKQQVRFYPVAALVGSFRLEWSRAVVAVWH